MANGISIPPWLNVGPLDPVQFYSQGIQLGQRAAAERNQNIMQAAQLAAQASENAAQQQRAQQAAELQALEFTTNLAEQKRKNELAARTSALRYEGMTGYERDLPTLGPEQALLKWGPKLFYDEPGTAAMMARTIPEQPFMPRIVDIEGTRVLQTGPRSYQRIPEIRPPPEGKMSDVDKFRAAGIEREITGIDKTLGDPMAVILSDEDKGRLETRRNALQISLETLLNKYGGSVREPVSQNKPASANRVRVIAPNGQRGWIPESQIEEAMKEGYKLAPAGASGSF